MGHDPKGAEDALECLVVFTAMEDAQIAMDCERLIKAELSRLKEESARLKLGVAEIMGGCVSGAVGGEDVVWFSEIETLWEKCAAILSPDDCSHLLETSDPAAILAALNTQPKQAQEPDHGR